MLNDSTRDGSLCNHLRCNENQKFLFAGISGPRLEQVSDVGNITQEWNLTHGIVFLKFKNTANHNSTPVFHQHLRPDMLGIDRNTLGRCFAAAVFCHIDIKDDIAFRGYLGRYFQFQGRLSKRC